MEKNSNSTIVEPTICKACMTFYANPKLGSYCSKCFSEQNKDESKKKKEKIVKEKDVKEVSVTEDKDSKDLKKEEKPIQVFILFLLYLNQYFDDYLNFFKTFSIENCFYFDKKSYTFSL